MFRRDFFPELLNSYSLVIQQAIVIFMLILQCSLFLQSQSIDFANTFYLENIPSGEIVLIGLPRYFKIDVERNDVVLGLKRIIYGQDEALHL